MVMAEMHIPSRTKVQNLSGETVNVVVGKGETSQELQMLSTVTLDCQVTIVRILISVSNVTSLQDCQNCQNCQKLPNLSTIGQLIKLCQKLSKL